MGNFKIKLLTLSAVFMAFSGVVSAAYHDDGNKRDPDARMVISRDSDQQDSDQDEKQQCDWTGDSPQSQYARYDIAQAIKSDYSYETFSTLIQQAGLEGTLKRGGPFTVFAPTDEAFDKLPSDDLDALTQPQNRAKLRKILKYHIVKGCHTSKDLRNTKQVRTLSGAVLDLSARDGHVYVNGAMVEDDNIRVRNGVIHGISSVLMPKGMLKGLKSGNGKDARSSDHDSNW